MHLAPCHLCPLRAGCELRTAWRAKVKGLGLRSASFACPVLAAEIRPGRRIVIKHPVRVDVQPDRDYDWAEIKKIEVPATILAASRSMHTFNCVVDKGAIPDDARPNEYNERTSDVRFRRRMKACRIVRFLDEPDGKLCRAGSVIEPDDSCGARNGHCACASDDRYEQKRAEYRATSPGLY